MPYYDFVCSTCQRGFELRTTMAAYAKEGKPACPACGSKATERKPAPFATTGKAGAPTGDCGLPREGCGMGQGASFGGGGMCGSGGCGLPD